MAAAVVLVILALLASGCMSIPGPGDAPKTPAVTPVTATPAPPLVTPQKTIRTAPTTKPVPVTTTQAPGYETSSCAAQGGTIVSPGQKCTAGYLPATDSFSCCSKNPVAIGSGNTAPANATITIPPLDLSLNLDDNPGSITP
ncbi:hypothetical protein [Methanoregula sp.]|jgi:hypothetical protein|uniref:hypothetical protein n=1 Tax=Methanoregula sp. TaxID=2052170 RepID=UPI003C186AE3